MQGINLSSLRKEVLEDYSKQGITLTEDEVIECLVDALRKKESLLLRKKQEERLNQNRLVKTDWTVKIIDSYMRTRAAGIFQTPFNFEGQCKPLYDLLCMYFANDPEFENNAAGLITNEASLEKGILLAGEFGVGKSWLMKLFQKQTRQVYFMRTTKQICSEYMDQQKVPDQYVNLFENAAFDASVFNQQFSGLCIDELGAEDVKNSFGNKSNVIGDIIEARYEAKTTGNFLHGITNLNAEGLNDFYGGRVTSRMKQIFNIIHFKGKDLRR